MRWTRTLAEELIWCKALPHTCKISHAMTIAYEEHHSDADQTIWKAFVPCGWEHCHPHYSTDPPLQGDNWAHSITAIRFPRWVYISKDASTEQKLGMISHYESHIPPVHPRLRTALEILQSSRLCLGLFLINTHIQITNSAETSGHLYTNLNLKMWILYFCCTAILTLVTVRTIILPLLT